MGDLNIDLLKYDTNSESMAFLGSMYAIFCTFYHNLNTGYNTLKNTH